MQTEPLPCPFCGYRAHAVQAQPEIRQEEWVTCLSCFTEITGDGAIARWNTREEVPDARIAELTKAYVSELDELAERNYKLRFEIAALKAQPSASAVVGTDITAERAAFEEHQIREGWELYLERYLSGDYKSVRVNNKWKGWLARARWVLK